LRSRALAEELKSDLETARLFDALWKDYKNRGGGYMSRIMIALGGAIFIVAPACGGVEEPSTERQDSAEHPLSNDEQPTAEPIGEATEKGGMSCEETTGEAQEALTKWQQVCIVGCQTFATAGCTAVGLSCTAGTLWSFGGILIPCTYAVLAACTGATLAGSVCALKCAGA
jgi:hypothetical protein